MKVRAQIYVLMAILLFSALSHCTDWRIGLTLYPTSLDTAYMYPLYFGQRADATDQFDPFLDVAAPPPPPAGFFPYIHGDDLIPTLLEDYRSEDSWDCLWQLSFRDDPGESVWVIWESDSFPFTIEYPIFMQYMISTDIPADSDWDSASSIDEAESIFVSCEQSVFFRFRDLTGVKEKTNLPENFDVKIYPNPFNSYVKIKVYHACDKKFSIKIFDLSGKPVFSSTFSREILWHPSEYTNNGLFLVRIEDNDGKSISKKLMFLK
ncbi:T9SS type A sorting domain-containing protein [bacterium]|nr:T9SS type A sorting domain-containing protein [bacterium]